MNTARQRIVVGVDGSAQSRAALAWAMVEAANRGAGVEVVTAYPVDFYWTDAYVLDRTRIDDIRADTEARARAMVEEVRQDPSVAVVPGAAATDIQVLVVAGPPAPHLVERSDGAALLVVGSRGRGAVRSTVAGSVALHCATHARCPVVVVHPVGVEATGPARVVVGLDDSDHGRAALTAAATQAAALGARVDAVVAYERPDYWSDMYGVMTPPPGETHRHALAQGRAMASDVLGPEPLERDTVRVRAVEGNPGQVLVREADGARLLVVGSRSRNPLPGMVLGSVALHCVMHAPCPVLVVRRQPLAPGEAAAQTASATASGS